MSEYDNLEEAKKTTYHKWKVLTYDKLDEEYELDKYEDKDEIKQRDILYESHSNKQCGLCMYYIDVDCDECPAHIDKVCSSNHENTLLYYMRISFVLSDKESYDKHHAKLLKWIEDLKE